MNEFLQFSLVPMAMAALAAIACALPGNFLLLRGQSLVGDAVSHVVLPGVVIGFLISGGASAVWIMAGAAMAAVIAAAAFEAVRRAARVEAGAAMGVVFTAMFALGVLLLEQSNARSVHLDVEHALYGNLESHIWLAAENWAALARAETWRAMPAEAATLAGVAAALSLLVALFFKELRLVSFDPDFARSTGMPTGVVQFAVVLASALAAVAAFSAVGSILVIAMFVCPPAAARLMTDDLARQVWLSAGVGAASAVIGFLAAGHAPLWLGFQSTVSAAGMIAVVSGLFVLGAAMFGARRASRA
ncbi:MAG: metal ABC transporter permease [Hyphomicrobiales bacterium]|nr:metal ABC transporter permease [Hyphomicrobiales bacterium]